VALLRDSTEPPNGPDRWFWPVLAVLVATAAAIRWGRLPVVWDYWAIDYLSYTYYHWADLSDGRFPWTRLIGMHPGQYALGMTLLLKLCDSLRTLMWLPVLASCASVVVGALWVRRQTTTAAGLLFGLLMTVSPYQAHYGIELNNYPLFLLVGSLLVVVTWACWYAPRTPRLVALGAVVAAAPHAHFFMLPMLAVLGCVVVATRRWRMLAAMAIGAIPTLPVLVAAATLPGEPASYMGSVAADLLFEESLAAWVGRFGTGHALLGVLLATSVGAISALRHRPTRRAAALLVAVIATLAVVNYIGFVTGAARIFQTPYWVLPSWCAFALIALGCGAGLRAIPAVIVLVLAVWFAESGHRAALPRSAAEARVGVWTADGVELLANPPDPGELVGYLDEHLAPGHVVLYLWDAMYINDEPHRYDPLFAAFPPGEVGAWDPESVHTGFGYRFRRGTVYFHNSVPLRGDERETSLAEAIHEWLAEGRPIHVVIGSVDPELPAPDATAMQELVRRCGGTWREIRQGDVRLIAIQAARPRSATADTSRAKSSER